MLIFSFSYAFFLFLCLVSGDGQEGKIYFVVSKIYFAFIERKKEKLFSSEKEKIVSRVLCGIPERGKFV